MSTPKTIITRRHLIDTARRLFAQKDKNSVTMNDIAAASNKGRRTLYSYFRNKEEVYLAVIETELDILIERLAVVAEMPISPERKLTRYIKVRFEAVKEAVTRNGSLKADFFRNIYEVERARRPIDIKEIRLLRQIIDEGVSKGVFKVHSSKWAAMILLYSLKGLEAPYLNNNISIYMNDHGKEITETFFYGLLTENAR